MPSFLGGLLVIPPSRHLIPSCFHLADMPTAFLHSLVFVIICIPHHLLLSVSTIKSLVFCIFSSRKHLEVKHQCCPTSSRVLGVRTLLITGHIGYAVAKCCGYIQESQREVVYRTLLYLVTMGCQSAFCIWEVLLTAELEVQH